MMLHLILTIVHPVPSHCYTMPMIHEQRTPKLVKESSWIGRFSQNDVELATISAR
jgi:hypothetical protein